MTSMAKIMKSDERMYIVSDDTSHAIGFVKVGHRHLYYYDRHGKPLEIDPLCVLDFYVREEFQRQGFGHAVMDFMIEVCTPLEHEPCSTALAPNLP